MSRRFMTLSKLWHKTSAIERKMETKETKKRARIREIAADPHVP
jgi:hypothetical protein